ncbi:DUF6766 family protein [Streptomyces sp. G5(2025)]
MIPVRSHDRNFVRVAVGPMAIFSVYLRQRGCPESKSVGSAHGATGAEG